MARGQCSKKRKTKAPDETEMYQHQGLAWVVGAQAIIRLYRRSLEAAEAPQGLQHQQDILAQANNMSTTYREERTELIPGLLQLCALPP
eukprot:3512905-Karenia_brevis.AAC.1